MYSRIFLALLFGFFMCVSSDAFAQMEYSTKGGNAFVQEVISADELPDGTALVTTYGRGFTWTNDPSVVGANGSMDCAGTMHVSADDEPQRGVGHCEITDLDGDLQLISWSYGEDGGKWGYVDGTGKYAGIEGGGTWSANPPMLDGKTGNSWSGSWVIPDMDEMDDMDEM